MWPIYLITLINAAANLHGWAANLQINAGLLTSNLVATTFYIAFFGVLAVTFLGQRPAFELPTHPIIRWIYPLYALAFIVGVGGLLLHDLHPGLYKDVGIAVRDFAIFISCIYFGHTLMWRPDAARSMVRLIVIAGVINAAMLLLRFVSRSEDVTFSNNWEAVRENAMVTNYSGLAALLILYSIGSGLRLMPTWLAIVLAGFCTVGQFAPLNRSDWLAYAAAGVAMVFCIPYGRRLRFATHSVVGAVAIALAVGAALSLAARSTGRDLTSHLEKKIDSMLPWTDQAGGSQKAWETRLPSIFHDWDVISANPFLGGGFGVQERMATEQARDISEFHHNAWTDFFAKTGIAGFAATLIMVGGMWVVGRRMARAAPLPSMQLLGALGAITAVYFTVLGAGTASFNFLQPGIVLGIIAGGLFRQRQVGLWAMPAQETWIESGTPGGSPTDADAENPQWAGQFARNSSTF